MFLTNTNAVSTDSTGHSAQKSFELLKNGLLIFEQKIAWKNVMFQWNLKGIVGIYNGACTPFSLALYYTYYMKVCCYLPSLGASIERYNNEAWHEDYFETIFKIPFH